MKLLIVACLLYLTKGEVLSGDQCAQGPSFWCAADRNAKQCGAEAYCRRHCWSYRGRIDQFRRDHMVKHNKQPQSTYTRMCTIGGDTVCHQCQIIIADLDNFLKNNQSLDSVLAAMRFFCNFLPSYSTLCRNMVTDIGTMIKSLQPYLDDPRVACEKMKLCWVGESGGLARLLRNVYTTNRNGRGDNSLCDDCKQACQEILAQLQDPAQQQNIKETFEAVCDFVGPLKNECLGYVDEFVPQLIQWIISRFTDPVGLCSSLGFC